MFSISISKNPAGMLEFLSSDGINGLKAVIFTFAGNFVSLKLMFAIGNSPSNSTFSK